MKDETKKPKVLSPVNQKVVSEEKTITLPSQKQETVNPSQGNILIVNERKLNIRLAPSLDAKILGYLVRGDAVTVIDEKDGWVKFQYGQIIGWSKRGFFIESADVSQKKELSSTPQIAPKNAGTDLYFVNSPRLNIRVSASVEAKTERHLVGGQNVTLLQIQGKWAQIQTEDGYVGWVALRYLTKR